MKLSEVVTHLTSNPGVPSAGGAALIPGFVPDTAPVEALVRSVRGLGATRYGLVSLSECPRASLGGLGELVQVVT